MNEMEWMRTIERESGFRRCLILYGNVRDLWPSTNGNQYETTSPVHPLGMLRNAIIWARPWNFLRISVINPTNHAQTTVK